MCRFLPDVGAFNFIKQTIEDIDGQRVPYRMMMGELNVPHSSLFIYLFIHLFI